MGKKIIEELILTKAAGSGATEAYPRGYVARRHTTENAAG
jgi:hypothetical protein